ncbi:hypothetical protein BMS3Abin14_01457 [bacterium BMS3Abin14]|nr:hypothetical protein BMS3Abin14_01457 [bacterium BMS3Abin14]
MWQWVIVIVSGICTFASFYLTFPAFRADDSGAFLFAGFGLLFGVPFVISVIKLFSGRSTVLKRIDAQISSFFINP